MFGSPTQNGRSAKQLADLTRKTTKTDSRLDKLEKNTDSRLDKLEKKIEKMEKEAEEMKKEAEEMKAEMKEKDREIDEMKGKLAAFEMKEKEERDHRNEVIEKLNKDATARDEIFAKMMEVEDKTTQRVAEGKTPNHDTTHEQTFAEVVKKTKEQFKEEMKETFKEMITESKQVTSNHVRHTRTPRHTQTELVIFGIKERHMSDRSERKNKEAEEIQKILKTIDKDWDNQGLTDHYRIGQYTSNNSKPRPTKIILDNNERMFNFLIKSKILKDTEDFTHIRVHKSLNKEDLETVREQLKIAEKRNNERSEEETKEFFWAIRGITAKKIYIRQNPTNEPA